MTTGGPAEGKGSGLAWLAYQAGSIQISATHGGSSVADAFCDAPAMKACQIGAALREPESPAVGELSLFPTQTPATSFGV